MRSDLAYPLVLGLLTALVLGFYIYTMQPSLSWGDGARLQLEAITGESFFLEELVGQGVSFDPYPFSKLGMAAWDHPVYVMLGYTLLRLFPALPQIWLINLISAIFGAAGVAILFQLAYRHTGSLLAASVASLTVAVSHTFWFHSVTAEVYTLFLFLLLGGLSAFDHYEQTGQYPFLLLSAFLLGLGTANHLLATLLLPALLLYVLISKRHRTWREIGARQVLGLGLAFLIGFSPYLIQLGRMLNAFSLSETVGPAVGSLFFEGLRSTTPRDLLQGVQAFLLYTLYQFNPLGLGIGIYGVFTGGAVSRELWRKVMAIYPLYTLFGILYRVTDQFAFFLTSHALFGLLIALGFAGMMRMRPNWRRVMPAALVAGIALTPAIYALTPPILKGMGVNDQDFGIPEVGMGVRDGLGYFLDPNQHGDESAYRFGDRFFRAAPPEVLLVAQWYTDTDELFVMEFFSRVEARRPDIEILGWPLQDPFAFDAEVVVEVVSHQVDQRPVYLASLSEEFYAASKLMAEYCIAADLDMYRVYPLSPTEGRAQGLACISSP